MVSATMSVNLSGLTKITKLLNGDSLGMFAAQTVHKAYTPAMPMNTGAYSQVISFKPWQYTHEMDYSAAVYTRNMNFRRDLHPYAMSYYIDGFESVAKPQVEKNISQYISTKVVK